MKVVSRSRALAAALIASITVAFSGGAAAPLVAHSSGALPGHTGAPGDADCTLCHTSFPANSGSATFELDFPLTVTPGGTHTVVATILNAMNPAKNGFQITARDGGGSFTGIWVATMVPPLFPVAKTQSHPFNVAYHEQTASGNNLDQWTMNWTAPPGLAPGPITFYAAANDADGDASASGDRIYLTTKKMFQASLATASTTWALGSLNAVTLTAPGHAGELYWIAPSESATPFPLGGPFDLQIDPTTGLSAYALNAPEFFVNLIGVLPPNDAATALVFIPNVPALSGLTLHFAGVTATVGLVPTEVSHRLTVTFQ